MCFQLGTAPAVELFGVGEVKLAGSPPPLMRASHVYASAANLQQRQDGADGVASPTAKGSGRMWMAARPHKGPAERGAGAPG